MITGHINGGRIMSYDGSDQVSQAETIGVVLQENENISIGVFVCICVYV